MIEKKLRGPPATRLTDPQRKAEAKRLLYSKGGKLGSQVEQFLGFLKHERNASPHTISAYKLDLSEFNKYIKENGINQKDINHRIIRGFLVRLDKKKNRKSTMGRKLSTIRAFYKFLVKIGACEDNPALYVSRPKAPQYLPLFFTEKEIEKLLETPLLALKNPTAAIENPALIPRDPFLSLRDKAILELLYGLGIRVSELVGIDTGDIDFENKTILIKGKGMKERIVVFGEPTKKYLNLYLNTRHLVSKIKDVNGALILNYRGERIGVRQVERLVKKYCRLAGLGDKLSPHSIRHSFASHLLNRGCDLRVIQELLGHALLSTTEKYTHISQSQLFDVYHKAHPRSHPRSNYKNGDNQNEEKEVSCFPLKRKKRGQA